VTGGQRSDIDGTLRSTIAGADFYFLNPAGVMFGPNASLDVQGSFHVSTTDELRFADGAKFSATDPSSSSFTVAAPEAFGFLAADPKPITVNESRLQLPAGEALSIVGGAIDIGLASVQARAAGSRCRRLVVPERRGSAMADRRADITLRHQSLLSTTGDGGGTIRIRGGAIVVEDGSVVFAEQHRPER
jgi:large exoprotein involved in heme utilization and adhesion